MAVDPLPATPTDESVVLEVRDLTVRFRLPHGDVEAVRKASLTVSQGEILALVGESGSGKSVTSRAVLGLLPSNAEVAGSVRLAGTQVLGLDGRTLAQLRGKRAAMVFQEPTSALNPVFTIGSQLVDTIARHEGGSRKKAIKRAVELLALVGIPDPGKRIGYYPHQLSGGQKQRVVIAMAISCNPDLIIADEPTTALDVTVQAEILALMRDLRDRLGTAILLITHNMGVVADLADRVAVMHDGTIVETAEVHDLFARPQDPYTQDLLSVVPRLQVDRAPADRTSAPEPTVLEVDGLTVRFKQGLGRAFLAVDGVTFSIGRMETLGVVGESGSGKSTIARTIAGLQRSTSGSVSISGTRVDHARAADLRRVRSTIGYVFQDPNWSLNPRRTVEEAIAAPLSVGERLPASEASHRIDVLLDAVRLATSVRRKHPHELSGGQSQRVSIARALIRRPSLLIADEPTSALDVSVQAQVLELLAELRAELRFACLFITHDLAVVSSFADSVVVMSRGRLVERGPTGQVLGSPEEPYTRRLVAAVPVADPVLQREHRRITVTQGIKEKQSSSDNEMRYP
ncbi:MAG: ABC transporter ATP-binding protein [Bifidobacteriaceae bacterium]|jgi:ABC-type glutathione transport system ATPase component|nr:ABC transporter ATP-binding protein [Bifidobacteriaceae bacterium]